MDNLKPPTGQAKELVIEFLNQSQNQNRKVPKKEIETYVENNLKGGKKLTAGMLSGALHDLVSSQKVSNPSRGNYVLNDQNAKNITDLRGEIRSILTGNIEEIERAVEGIDFELQDSDAAQIQELLENLSSYRLKFLFPAK